jgi:hypothetical protein
MSNLTAHIDRIRAWIDAHPDEAPHVRSVDITSHGVCALDLDYESMQRLFAGKETHCTTMLGYEHLTYREGGIEFRSMRPFCAETSSVIL